MNLQYLSPQTQEAIISVPPAAYAAAVAIATGYACPIPSGVVQDIKAYTDGSVGQALDAIVGTFNEVRPLPIDEVVLNAKNVYQARYEVAFGLIIEKAGSANFADVLDLFGIGFCISGDFVGQLKLHSADIMKVLPACLVAARQIVQPKNA